MLSGFNPDLIRISSGFHPYVDPYPDLIRISPGMKVNPPFIRYVELIRNSHLILWFIPWYIPFIPWFIRMLSGWTLHLSGFNPDLIWISTGFNLDFYRHPDETSGWIMVFIVQCLAKHLKGLQNNEETLSHRALCDSGPSFPQSAMPFGASWVFWSFLFAFWNL